jgi:RNA polymerase sigma-70 factor (ECF subfamily)
MLYDRHGAVAYGLAFAITSHEATAEQAVADAFAQLWREAPSYDAGRMTFLAWMTTIVRQRALDRRRSLPSTNMATSAARGDSRLLDTLAPEQRRVVELAFFDGYSRGEIAVTLQLTEGAVGELLRSAADRLKSHLPPSPVGSGGASSARSGAASLTAARA